MKKWAVQDEFKMHTVIIEAGSIRAAAEKGIDWLVEAYPEDYTCRECETVTLKEVDVWPLEEGQRWSFERQTKLVKLGTKANPE